MQHKKQQRVSKEALQARFAARLRTTPDHRQAVEALETAKRAKANAESAKWVTSDPEGLAYWQRSAEFWQSIVDGHQERITMADFWAKQHADELAENTLVH